VALAEIHGESCGQCGVLIRPHLIQQLQRGDNDGFQHCETCTRILYYPEHSAAAGSPGTPNPAAPSAGDSPAAPPPEH
jgi:hypothetical protein